jgi:NADPH-dependent ferric siderophore reductase
VAEVDSKADELILTSNADLQVTWVYRRGTSAGDPDAILNTLTHIALPHRDVFAWAAAESKVARAIRHHHTFLSNRCVETVLFSKSVTNHSGP